VIARSNDELRFIRCRGPGIELGPTHAFKTAGIFEAIVRHGSIRKSGKIMNIGPRARESADKPAETRAAAARLSQDLGYLPLALAIARSQAWGMNWSFDQYRDHLAEMLNRAPTGPVDYPRSVFATFTLALEKAISTAPEAETLLGIAAYLAPDRIPFDIIKVSTFRGVLVALAGGALDVMSEIERGEAVAALSEGSLITLKTLDDNSKGPPASIRPAQVFSDPTPATANAPPAR
jgi:hypothetical protein